MPHARSSHWKPAVAGGGPSLTHCGCAAGPTGALAHRRCPLPCGSTCTDFKAAFTRPAGAVVAAGSAKVSGAPWQTFREPACPTAHACSQGLSILSRSTHWSIFSFPFVMRPTASDGQGAARRASTNNTAHARELSAMFGPSFV